MNETTSQAGAELLEAIGQMRRGEKARVYTPKQLLAISARRSTKRTQREFAQLLNVSVHSVQDWEQGRRSPPGAAKTLLRIAQSHPDILEQTTLEPEGNGLNQGLDQDDGF